MCKFKSVLYSSELKKIYQIYGINSHSTISEQLKLDEDKLYKYEIELFDKDKIRIELDSTPYNFDDNGQGAAYDGAMVIQDYYAKEKNKNNLFNEAKENITLNYKMPDYVSEHYYSYFEFRKAPNQSIDPETFSKIDKTKAKIALENGLDYTIADDKKIKAVKKAFDNYSVKLKSWELARDKAKVIFDAEYITAEKAHAKKYKTYILNQEKAQEEHDQKEKELVKNLKSILEKKEWEYSEEGFFKGLIY